MAYIPNVGKPIRITSLQSVVGGVFNNADIMRLDYHVEYDVQQLEDMEPGIPAGFEGEDRGGGLRSLEDVGGQGRAWCPPKSSATRPPGC